MLVTSLVILVIAGCADCAAVNPDDSWMSSTPELRKHFISSHTQEPHYKAYLTQWKSRVGSVAEKMDWTSTLDHMDATVDAKLILQVAINPDGSIRAIEVLRSTCRSDLDDFAVSIVKKAAPFEPFPETIREQTDILVIVSTLQYSRQ